MKTPLHGDVAEAVKAPLLVVALQTRGMVTVVTVCLNNGLLGVN